MTAEFVHKILIIKLWHLSKYGHKALLVYQENVSKLNFADVENECLIISNLDKANPVQIEVFFRRNIDIVVSRDEIYF